MADDNKNLAGEGERTSILPQSGGHAAEQTEVLPTHVSQAQTAQMPPIAQEESGNAFAGTPLEPVAESSADEQAGDEVGAGGAETVAPASKKSSWGKRAAIAGAAAAILSVGFGAGLITHAAIVGDGEDYYEQGYEDGYNDQGYGDEDEGFGPDNGSQGPGNGQQQGPGNGQQQGPGSGQRGPGNGQRGPGSQKGDTGSTRPGPPPEGGRGPGSKSGSQGNADSSTQDEETTAS